MIHSAEGSLAGAFSVLDGPRQASWHFFVTKTGEVYQHVDTDEIAWTNGSREANTKFWGIECEGVVGEALTEPQFQALVQVVRWLWATHQVGAAVRQETLFEHREMTRFGAPATSCPSGRIPWAALINELEDDMPTAEEIRAIVREEVQAAMNASEAAHQSTRTIVVEQVNAASEAAHQATRRAIQPGGGLTFEKAIEAAQEAARRGTG